MKKTSQLGSLSIKTLNKKLPGLTGRHACYTSVQDTVSKAEYLTKQKNQLQNSLSNILEQETMDPTCYLLKRLEDIRNDINTKDREMFVFAKKAQTIKNIPFKMPEFEDTAIFDFDVLSGVNQSSFFNADILSHENSRLAAIVQEGLDAQEKLRYKLKLFKRAQNRAVVKERVQQIQNGSVPLSLTESYSHRYAEIEDEIFKRRAELQQLRKEYQGLNKMLWAEHAKLRRASMIRMSRFSVERLMRRGISQEKIERMMDAATLIQRHWRQYMMKKGLNLKFNLVPPPKSDQEQRQIQMESSLRTNTTLEILRQPLLDKMNSKSMPLLERSENNNQSLLDKTNNLSMPYLEKTHENNSQPTLEPPNDATE